MLTGKQRKKRKIILSVENDSILRKFSALFFIIAILPVSILYYLYRQVRDFGAIKITENELNRTLIIVVIGVIVGFFAMRKIILKIVELTQLNRDLLSKFLSDEQIEELSGQKNELNILATSFRQITEKLEENVRSLELAKRTMHSVMEKIGQGISNMNDIDNFLSLILETISEGLSCQYGILLVIDKSGKFVSIKGVYGMRELMLKSEAIAIQDEPYLKELIAMKQTLLLEKSSDKFNELSRYQVFDDDRIIFSPLIVHDQVKGIIFLSGQPKEYEENLDDDMGLLFNLGSQMAVAIENAELNQDMEATYFETISALALAVDAKDKYSRGHLDRVANYCVLIAEKLGLDESDVTTLRDAARLHDIGKIGIPDEVLLKNGKLSDEEWVLMRQHPEIGESIVRPIKKLSHLCDIIRHHHEKLDGTGYPDGLKGENIAPLVRITTIADIFDALTSERPYRQKMSYQSAINEMKKLVTEIDLDILDVFEEALIDSGKIH